ncbi:hypothetical protein [Undibacterium sp. KW1]|uniref:bestrophin-like domain n=1 Tax=Undibacterium sp. KW1 TaxID=2058624 RepID=UPI0013893C0D|nr:hypothetical protein [Undibacterium sp. KW1]
MTNEFMYGQSTALIVFLLLACMLIATELAYRNGLRKQMVANDAAKSQINTLQASMLGLLALLLSFAFSLALQRFDERNQSVVNEANAIGTTYLRTQLLPLSVREHTQTMLKQYIDLRVEEGQVSLADVEKRDVLIKKTSQISDQLWALAMKSVELDKSAVTTGMFVQSLNDTIDAFGKRDAGLQRHVPETVVLLLLITIIMTAATIGYASGLTGQRAVFATLALQILISMAVFLTIDLDRPRRGFIQVSQLSMLNLQQSVHAKQ